MKQTYLFCLLLVSLFSSAQIINLPNAFKTKLLAANSSNYIAKNLSNLYFKIDSNNNYEIELNEALQVSYLNISNSSLNNVSGIENFNNLKELNCSSNQLTSLAVSNLTNMIKLDFSNNQITNLNVSNLTLLTNLNCTGNHITTLNASNLTNLIDLACGYNTMTNLNVSNSSNLLSLQCNNNQLMNLDVSNLSNLVNLYCHNNYLTTLDVSNSISLNNLNCYNNQLQYINIKNGNGAYFNFYFFNNPNLKYICTDEEEITWVQQQLTNDGLTNCNLNTYCTFVPGGNYNIIQGSNKFDNENDGCDINDIYIPNLKYLVNYGNNTEYFISNNGLFSFPTLNGTYTITPILENPNYYSVYPTNLTVNFPTQSSPVTQDFCLTIIPHHNVEVTILPITVARPGFDTSYKIIYNNKGNQVENGTINFQFNDAVLDLVSSNPTFTTQTTNNLSFNYSNLQPFETREISVVLNVNSPMETPPVNSGYQLNYLATITQNGVDEVISDNTFALKQIVVNSYDPNDKTCLQGPTISPSEVGKYVHYMIRFENTGTFPAENIVVKDMIDTDKFDIASLVPLKASHNYITRISGNKVEFIFENINLPFNNATNDGYIAFKIKTKPTLVVGDTFSNSANIYFDYNFPIVTNTATTTIAVLSNPSFEFGNYFSLYPNPTTKELNINLKQAIEINSIQIYNTIGQLVTVQTGKALKVDVSNLKTGNYFIKINANEGYSTSQFIKE